MCQPINKIFNSADMGHFEDVQKILMIMLNLYQSILKKADQQSLNDEEIVLRLIEVQQTQENSYVSAEEMSEGENEYISETEDKEDHPDTISMTEN